MIRAQSNQVIQGVGATLTSWCDVMHVCNEMEPAYLASVAVSLAGLIHYVSLSTAFPVLGVFTSVNLRVGFVLTYTVAVVAVLHLAWVYGQRIVAFVAMNNDLVLASTGGGHTLPFAIAGILTTGYRVLAFPVLKSVSTYRAIKGLLATSKVAVVRAFVLVAVDETRCSLTRIATEFNGLFAPASAQDRCLVHAPIISEFAASR